MDSVETQVFAKKASPEAQKSPALGSETPGELSRFVARHIGPNDEEVSAMLAAVGFENLDTFIDATVPKDIRLTNPLDLPAGKSEQEALAELRRSRSKTRSSVTSLAPATPIASCHPSSSAIFWKIPAGTLPTRRIRPRSRRAASKRCSISRR